jgi:hypothetical protein
MVMLYFDLCEGRKLYRDEQGSLFDSIEAARYSAIQSLLELLKARPIMGDTAELMYVVKDISGRTVFIAQVSASVARELWRRRRSGDSLIGRTEQEQMMTHYADLDVSQKETTICIVDEQGRRLWRGTAPTDPRGDHPDAVPTRL